MDYERKRAKAFTSALSMTTPPIRAQMRCPAAAPAHLESDQKPLGTDSFVRSFADVAQVKGVTGYRVLMHNKYIVRDAASADAAVFTGSSNYTNDSWGLQDNNLLCLRSQQLASYYAGF
jgi:phosphatidylserine/phosphatidylglycerophosphate/cardiolipin synthase-like enzyme